MVGFADGLIELAGSERRLAELLTALEVIRPDRPLDSLAIAIPWTFLAANGSGDTARDAIVARGRQLYRLVLTVQQRTGWRVPVHVLLTGCEAVPGFATYAAAALERSDYPVIGWPAPRSLDSMFETSWLDEAFATLTETLSAQQMHLLMGLDHQPSEEAVLLLPGRIAAIKPALTVLLTQMLQSSAYHEGFMLRGIFLTGDATAVSTVPAVVPAAAAVATVPAYPTQRLGQALFRTKIFPESQLAQPAYGERTRRHRLVLWTKIALGAALGVAACLLIGIRYQNGQRMVPVHALLQNIIDIKGSRADDCADEATGPGSRIMTAADFDERRRLSIALLDRMSELDVNHVSTVLAPTSFLADTDDNVELAIKTSFHDVVFHAIAESMATPAGVQALVRRDALDPAAAPYWTATLRNVVAYDANYRAVRSLETRSVRDTALVSNFAQIVRYALGSELPAGFTRNYRLYASGIAHNVVPCITSSGVRNALRQEITDRYAVTRYRQTVGPIDLPEGF